MSSAPNPSPLGGGSSSLLTASAVGVAAAAPSAKPALQRIDALVDKVQDRTKHWVESVQGQVRTLEAQLVQSTSREAHLKSELEETKRQLETMKRENGRLNEDLVAASGELLRTQRLKAARARLRTSFQVPDSAGSPAPSAPFENSATDAYYAGYGGATHRWPESAMFMGGVHDDFSETVLTKVETLKELLPMPEPELVDALVSYHTETLHRRKRELSQNPDLAKGISGLLREERALLDLAGQLLVKRNTDLIKRTSDQALALARSMLLSSLSEIEPSGKTGIEKDLRRAIAMCREARDEAKRQLGPLAITESGNLILDRLDGFGTQKTLEFVLHEPLWEDKVVVVDPSKPLVDGWLVKEGGNIRNWKKRWCELMSDGTLFYYKAPGEDNAAGSVYVPGALALPAPELGEFGFTISKVHGTSRVFRFKALSQPDLSKWLDGLKPLIQKNRNQQRVSRRLSLADGVEVESDEWDTRRSQLALPQSEILLAQFSAVSNNNHSQRGWFHVTQSYLAFMAFQTKNQDNKTVIHLCDIASVEKATSSGLQNSLRITLRPCAGGETFFFSGFFYKKRGMAYQAVLDAMAKRVPLSMCYGVDIEKVPLTTGVPLPLVLFTNHLSQPHLIATEGLFRLPGTQRIVDEIQRSIDRGERAELDSAGPHNVSHAFKQWLRMLPQALIPAYDAAVSCATAQLTGDTTVDAAAIKSVLLQCHATSTVSHTLRFLIRFLAKVASHSAQNKMTAQNLATCFTPNLIRMTEAQASIDPIASLSHAPHLVFLVSRMIELHQSLWPSD